MQLIATLGSDDVDARDIEGVIRRDPVIAARVLSAANSAAYAGHMPAASIHAAVMRLGLVTIRRLALLLSLNRAVPGSAAQRTVFWRHSLAVAHATEVVIREIPVWQPSGLPPEQAFVAALLHDLGAMALMTCAEDDDARVRRVVAEAGVPRWQAEREVLGTDHAQIGATLAERWSFPPTIVEVIGVHHALADAPGEVRWIATVVALADALCSENEATGMGEGANVGMIEEAVAFLGLPPDALGRIVDGTQAEAARALTALTDGRA